MTNSRMITALVAIVVLAALAGAATVATAGVRKEISLVDRVDALLPQTQCRRCTFDGCRPYAEAVAQGAADINQCPPGGERTAKALARLMGVEPKPVGKEFGVVPDSSGSRVHRRRRLHRLHQVHSSLSRRCHRRRLALHAHRDRGGLHRM